MQVFSLMLLWNTSRGSLGWGVPIRKYLQTVYLYTGQILPMANMNFIVLPNEYPIIFNPELVRPEVSLYKVLNNTYGSRVWLGAWTTSSGSSPATSTNRGPRGSRHGAPRWRGRAQGHPRPTRRDRARSMRSASWGWGSADPWTGCGDGRSGVLFCWHFQ